MAASVANRALGPVSYAKPAVVPNLQIAFWTNRDFFNGEIYVMNADGSNQVNVSNHPGFDLQPVWSPDGSKIVFRENADGGSNLVLVNATGGSLQQLTDAPGASSFGAAWSPNGSKIAFVQADESHQQPCAG